MNRRVFEISLVAALLACCVISPDGDAAKKKKAKTPGLYQCFGPGCNIPSIVEEVDPEAQAIIWKLSHQPELMNVEYLKYWIGRPHNEKHARTQINPNFHWKDKHEKVRYELQLTQQQPGQVVHAQMTVNLDGMGISFDKLAQMYGQPAKRFYDYQAHPAEIYTFVPGTYVCFSSPANTFRCNTAKIVYSGPALPQPSMTDIAEAEAAMVARGAAFGVDGELTTETLPILAARVKARPMDPEAHLHLADAYRLQSQINGAIGEYKLALSGHNLAVRDKALNALRQMHVIDDADPLERRRLELVHGGQALRAVSNEKKPQPNTAPPNPPNQL
jgi:hypothetical protein